MTPTEQDKGLREAITKIVEAEYKSPNYIPAVERVDHIMQLFTADRKRVALEARIEAAEHILNTMVSRAGGYCDEIKPDAIPDYIAELKKQKEEL